MIPLQVLSVPFNLLPPCRMSVHDDKEAFAASYAPSKSHEKWTSSPCYFAQRILEGMKASPARRISKSTGDDDYTQPPNGLMNCRWCHIDVIDSQRGM